ALQTGSRWSHAVSLPPPVHPGAEGVIPVTCLDCHGRTSPAMTVVCFTDYLSSTGTIDATRSTAMAMLNTAMRLPLASTSRSAAPDSTQTPSVGSSATVNNDA